MAALMGGFAPSVLAAVARPTLVVSRAILLPGTTLAVSGSHFDRKGCSSQVVVTLAGPIGSPVTLGKRRVARSGAFSLSSKMPHAAVHARLLPSDDRNASVVAVRQCGRAKLTASARLLVLNGADALKPQVTFVGQPTTTPDTSVAWTTSGLIDSTTCLLDSESEALPCLSPQTFAGLGAGPHQLKVTVTGPAGSSFKVATWSTVAPAPARLAPRNWATRTWLAGVHPETVAVGNAVRIFVPVTAAAGARCTLTVAKLRLPDVVAGNGGVTWSWVQTRNSPSAPFKLSAHCYGKREQWQDLMFTEIFDGPATGRDPQVVSGTVAVDRGRLVKPMFSEAAGPPAAGDPNRFPVGSNTWGTWRAAPWLGSAVTGSPATWISEATSGGLVVGSVPALGAVFVGAGGGVGISGVVTKLRDSKSVWVREMNHGSLVAGQVFGHTTDFAQYTAHIEYLGSSTSFIYDPANVPLVGVRPYVHIDPKPRDSTATSVTFTWKAGPAGGRLVCLLDRKVLPTCASPYTTPALDLGPHSFRVELRASGGTAYDLSTWLVFPPPPTVTILQKPADGPSQNVSLTWATNGVVDSVTCTFDGVDVPGCSMPFKRTKLPVGSHTFGVSAHNAGPVKGTDTATWSIIIPPPTVKIDTKPQTGPSQSVRLTWKTTGIVDSVTCSFDGVDLPGCPMPFTRSGLTLGPHTFAIAAHNAGDVDGTDTTTWSIVIPPPTVKIDVKPTSGSSQSVSLTWKTTGIVDSVTCTFDGVDVPGCPMPFTRSGLALGAHTFVIAAHNAGLIDGTDSATWTISVPRPAVSVAAPPSSTATTANVTWTTTGIVDSTSCAIDGGAPTTCTSPKAYAGLAVGSHTVTVVATNAGGSSAPGAVTWEVFPPAPTVTLTTRPSGNTAATSMTLAWTTSGVVDSTTCRIDGAPTACAGTSVTLTGLSYASHTFTITVTNKGGTSPTDAATWTVIPPAPTVVITGRPGNVTSNGYTVSIPFSVSGVGVTVTCSLNGSTPGACGSPASYGIGPGNYTFQVWARNAGGSATDSASWSVATPPPPRVVSVAHGPAHTIAGACTSSACAYITVSFSGFSGGNHTVVCNADNAPSFYTYTTASTATNVCVYGYAGHAVWATVDGVASAAIAW